jgi:hypothetical protein
MFLYADHDSAIGLEFLRRCLAVAERIIEEDKPRQGRCIADFPLNRGQVLRASAHAHGILGKTDPALFRDGSVDFESWVEKTGRWDDQDQAYYLAAARLALIGDDLGHARELLGVERSIKDHPDQAHLVRWLSTGGRVPRGPSQRKEVAKFERFFSTLRNPKYKSKVFTESSMLRWELGVLRDKYLISEDGFTDWKRVIVAVSE